jgi:predicted metal-dependent RNase
MVSTDPTAILSSDHRLTDGISINFNAQFLDDEDETLVFVSECTRSST